METLSTILHAAGYTLAILVSIPALVLLYQICRGVFALLDAFAEVFRDIYTAIQNYRNPKPEVPVSALKPEPVLRAGDVSEGEKEYRRQNQLEAFQREEFKKAKERALNLDTPELVKLMVFYGLIADTNSVYHRTDPDTVRRNYVQSELLSKGINTVVNWSSFHVSRGSGFGSTGVLLGCL
jgi:hypothetical protein